MEQATHSVLPILKVYSFGNLSNNYGKWLPEHFNRFCHLLKKMVYSCLISPVGDTYFFGEATRVFLNNSENMFVF